MVALLSQRALAVVSLASPEVVGLVENYSFTFLNRQFTSYYGDTLPAGTSLGLPPTVAEKGPWAKCESESLH